MVIDANKFKETINTIYSLIDKELSNVTDIEARYPKLVVMYEFFRLLRGEAFSDYREPMVDFQNEMYKMEDDIFERLKSLKAELPQNSSKAQYMYENIVSQGLRIDSTEHKKSLLS